MRCTILNNGTIVAQTITMTSVVVHIRDDSNDHDKFLKDPLKCFQHCGLTFNLENGNMHLPFIEFFGFVFLKDRIQPAPSKVNAIKQMDSPPKRLRGAFSLGMAYYFARFIPTIFAELSKPFQSLTHQGTKWKWCQKEQSAYNQLEETLSSSSVLWYYETPQCYYKDGNQQHLPGTVRT